MPMMISSYFRPNSKSVPRRGPFLFTNLPTELCLLVLAHAARPTFAPNHTERKKPYSSALALCRVSRAIRCMVFPELLHTILLSKAKHMIAFISALKMQQAYAQQDNHLHVDYAAHVRRIWIGGTQIRHSIDICSLSLDSTDFSLLAPVLLAATSLAIDYRSLSLLNSCLEYAGKSHIHSNVDKSSPPPWSIKTLTLSGDLADYRLTDSVPVYAFLASISHIIFLSPTRFRFEGVFFPWRYGRISDKLLRYNIFERMSRNPFPWAALQNLQSVSLALPHLMPPIMSMRLDACAWRELCWKDVPIELRTFTAPMVQLSGHWAQEIPDACGQRGEGRISSANVRATLIQSSRNGEYLALHWEQAWACGLHT
jgi:hypothetical protein